MAQYMVDIRLPKEITPEFAALIPRQRKAINRLFEQGRIISYTLSLERARLWVVCVAANEEEVLAILAKFPLLKFMRFDIYELMFHQSMSSLMPVISLN